MRVEDILFWILILAAIGIAIWLAFGSPDFETSLISIIIFVASSEILLWKFLFSLDKKTALGFEKVGGNTKEIRNNINGIKQNIENINLKTNRIGELILKINKKLRIR